MAANHAASLPAAAGNPQSAPGSSLPQRAHLLPSDVWSAAFKISRTTSLSSWSGCRKSRTWVKAGLTWEQRLELQLNRRKGFSYIATPCAGASGKKAAVPLLQVRSVSTRAWLGRRPPCAAFTLVNPTRCCSSAAQTSTELSSRCFQLQLRHSAGAHPPPGTAHARTALPARLIKAKGDSMGQNET